MGGLPSQRTQGSQFEYSTLWSWAVTFRNTKKSPFLHPTAGSGTEIAQRVALRRLRELKLRRPALSPQPPLFSVQFFYFYRFGVTHVWVHICSCPIGSIWGLKDFSPIPPTISLTCSPHHRPSSCRAPISVLSGHAPLPPPTLRFLTACLCEHE